MKISNKSILRSVFYLKGQLRSNSPPEKVVHGDIEIAPFRDNAQAAGCISADFELNWAWRSLPLAQRNIKGTTARENVPLILDILDKLNIPITWAIVGHLFLSTCQADSLGIKHSNMPRPSSNEGLGNDWYSFDPATNYQTDNLWYAPDLVKNIISRKVTHEIGTHSFSHIDFSDKNEFLIKKELEACHNVMEPFTQPPRSLVFPLNIMGYKYLNILSDQGITAVRHRDQKIRLCYPERTSQGVYKIYESMNLRHTQIYEYVKKAEIFLDKAMKDRSVYHLWFHPSDPPDLFQKEFTSICRYMAQLRDEGRLWIATMAEIASYCEARRTLEISIVPYENGFGLELDCRMDRERYGETVITLLIPVSKPPLQIESELSGKKSNLLSNDFLYLGAKKIVKLNVSTSVRRIAIYF